MPILSANTVEFFSRSPEQTRRVGMRLGGMLSAGMVVCLQGELGAGKTTFVQGLARGWGSLDNISSPSFVLVNVYRRLDEARFFHLDTYRLESAPEVEELDLDAMLSQGPLVVEWPERMQSLLPQARLWVKMDWLADEHRLLVFSAQGNRYDGLLAEFRQQVFGVV